MMIIKSSKFNPFVKADKVILSANHKSIIKINSYKTKSGLPVESRTIYPCNKQNFDNYVIAVAKKNNFNDKNNKKKFRSK